MQNYTKPFSYLALSIILLVPIFMVKDNLSINSTTDFLFLAHRFLGLYAFSLMFLQILTGSSRPLLQKVFNGSYILRFHMGVGKIAFLLAVLHPILLFSTYLTEKSLVYITSFMEGGSLVFFSAGIIAYTLMFLSVGAAIYRMRIGPKWIYVHRINYLIFWLVFFHSLGLGVDIQSSFSHSIYYIYGTIAFMLTVGRWFVLIRQKVYKNQEAKN